MTRQDILAFYEAYVNHIQRMKELENELYKDTEVISTWIAKLKHKSKILREMYAENEAAIARCIRPYVNDDTLLTDTLADAFLDAVYTLNTKGFFDYFIACDVLQSVIRYLERQQDDTRLINAYFQLALQLHYTFFPEYDLQSVSYFDKIAAYTDRYFTFSDERARRRILVALYNRAAIYVGTQSFSFDTYFAYFDEAVAFWNRPDVKQADAALYDTKLATETLRYALAFSRMIDFTDCTEAQLERIYQDAKTMYEDALNENDDNPLSIDNAVFLHYQKAAFSKGLIDVDTYYQRLQSKYQYSFAYHSTEELFDTTDDEMFNAFYYVVPTMIELLDRTSLPRAKAHMQKKRLIQEFVSYITELPHGVNDAVVNANLAECIGIILKHTDSYEDTLHYLLDLTVHRQLTTAIHSIMVGRLARYLTIVLLEQHPEYFIGCMGFSTKEEVITAGGTLLRLIYDAALIHDIGKTFHINVINQHTRPISDGEFVLIRQHCRDGYRVLSKRIGQEAFLAPLLDIVLGHHKFYNGEGGYPSDFYNTSVSNKLLIDIISICDSIDAATDIIGRNYTVGKSFSQVLDELEAGSGTRYNGDIVATIRSCPELIHSITHLTTKGRELVYYEVYTKYVSKNAATNTAGEFQ